MRLPVNRVFGWEKKFFASRTAIRVFHRAPYQQQIKIGFTSAAPLAGQAQACKKFFASLELGDQINRGKCINRTSDINNANGLIRRVLRRAI